jgi:hypothetical protein
MGTVAGRGGQETRARRPTRLERELARAPVWDVGDLDSADWGEAVQGRTLAEDLVAAIRAPEGAERTALLETLARHPLLVSPWVAVPEVRARVAELGGDSDGPRARRFAFPYLCRFALGRAWDEVSPQPGADVHDVARRLHPRAICSHREARPWADRAGNRDQNGSPP